MNTDDNPRLEKAVHRMLRSLPDRPAPRSLEGRVLAEIARRAALPWWRKSFAHWPGAARILFVVLCGLSCAAIALGAFEVGHSGQVLHVMQSLSSQFARYSVLADIVTAAGDRLRQLADSVPQYVIYAAAAAVVGSTGAIAALAAAAYRAAAPASNPS